MSWGCMRSIRIDPLLAEVLHLTWPKRSTEEHLNGSYYFADAALCFVRLCAAVDVWTLDSGMRLDRNIPNSLVRKQAQAKEIEC